MQKIKKAVIPIAGKGTRVLPIAKVIPKHLFPIINKPIIHYLVEELIEAGVEEIIFIVNGEDNMTEKYFTQNKLLEEYLIKRNKEKALSELLAIPTNFKMHFITQTDQNGSGDAILLAKEYLQDESFLVLYGDDLIVGDNACKELIKIYEETNEMVIGVKDMSLTDSQRYGVIKWEENSIEDYGKIESIMKKVDNLNEKRSSFIGRAILTKDIFYYLEQITKINREIGLSYAIEDMLKEKTIYGCLIRGDRYDIGNKEGYLKAILSIANEEKTYE